jgi:hypothetical protein
MASEPKTLQEAIVYFADPDNCLNYLAVRRWKDGAAVCPTCGSDKVSFLPSRRLWQCKTRHPKAQFSIKVGTIFEDSAIGLDKWLTAMWMVANCKNGISSYEIHRDLGITQKTAWFMLQRIRLAMQDDSGGKLSGEVEVDETYIGGKARNMHKDRRARVLAGRAGGVKGKAGVQGMLERDGQVKTKVLGSAYESGHKLVRNITEAVEPGTHIYTDEARAYFGIPAEYTHEFINHAEAYVNGNIHTNGLENFWSLLKRGLGGTYVSVEPFHLFRYVDEQAFRYNHRKDANGEKLNDGDRFHALCSRIVGKRLTFAEVTGKTGAI